MIINNRKLATYTGLFVFSLSLLMAEIVYSRTAKIAFGYEYQLLVISLAISGIGFGGIPVFFFLKKINARFDRILVSLALIYSISIPIPFITVNSLGVTYAVSNVGEQLTYFGVTLATMGKFFAAVFFVYFLAGMLIASFLSHDHDRIPFVYFLNLAGAAIGAFAVVPLLDLFGNETTVVIIYVISLVPVLIFAFQGRLRRFYVAGVLGFVVLSSVALGYFAPMLRVGGVDKSATVATSNSISQIDVYQVDPLRMAKGLSSLYNELVRPNISAYNMIYDRKLKTNAIVYSRLSDTQYLTYDLFYFPYLLKKQSEVLIIGAGGGVDVVRARLAHSKQITALEVNPLMVDIARNRLKSKAFDDSSVNLVIGEGRNFISQSRGKFDLIFLSNTGGFGGQSVNSRYYPENYLHTEEAYVAYLDHLSKDGILAVSNKDVVVKDLMGVGIGALKRKGIEAEDHVVLVEAGGLSVVMFKPAGFSKQEKTIIIKNARRHNFMASFPSLPSTETGLTTHLTDDNPFLASQKTIEQIFNPDSLSAGQPDSYSLYGAVGVSQTQTGKTSDGDGLLALRILLAIALFGLLVSLVLLLPPPFFRSVRAKKRSWQVLGLLGYNMFLGLGFIGFEMVMLQRSFLFIAHPTYSVAVVLFSFLFFGGLGSLATQKIDAARFKVSVAAIVTLLSLVMFSYAYLLNRIFIDLLYLSLAIRIPLFIALLAVPCFLTGTLFPLGLRTADMISEELIPWIWSVNGLAIVLGGAIGALGSFFIGFRFVMGVAAGFYVIALIIYLSLKPAETL